MTFLRATALALTLVGHGFAVEPEPTAEDGAAQWERIAATPDPTAPLLEHFRRTLKSSQARAEPTGLGRADYLALIASEVDFWKSHQDANGAILDPYSREEIQYSTPAFAHAAAALAAWHDRKDLIEPAAKALDWSTLRLSERKAANSHEDFYGPMVAHAMNLLKPLVPSDRYAKWAKAIESIDPWKTYRKAPGSMNWNVVSACGEELFELMGLTRGGDYVEMSLAAQGVHFTSPHGLYVEGPMAYDLFPRMYMSDIIASGYDGNLRPEIEEMLRRGAITSLFMQSPWGELPAGGRSAHHQWNEAEQCAVFEIFGAAAARDGDDELAGVYKRAAHLALRSMQRWVRPSGEMQIVKNWVDPKDRHGYEPYSSHTQYNLLPMSMLALAAGYATPTEDVTEQPAPADLGGYVLQLPEFHKVIANSGGTYAEIETLADPHYDATGLIRIQFPDLPPQLGPSDSVLASPAYHAESKVGAPANTGVGVAWMDDEGRWRRLGELGPNQISEATVADIRESTDSVSFTITYAGQLFGPSRITETYVLQPGRLELTTSLDGYNGPLRYIWPVLADDGREKTRVSVADRTIEVAPEKSGGIAQTFTAPGASKVEVGNESFPNHNGLARLAVAEFPADTSSVTLIMAPQPSSR